MNPMEHPPRPWLEQYGPNIPPDLVIPQISLVYNLVESAARHPRRTCVKSTQGYLRYSEMLEEVQRFAGFLKARGLGNGQRVFILLPNCIQMMVAFYGSLWAGCTCVLTSPQFSPELLQEQLRDSQPDLLILPTPTPEGLRDAVREVEVPHLLLTSGKEYNRNVSHWLKVTANKLTSKGPKPLRWRQQLAEASLMPEPAEVDPYSTAAILYTGGTTGIPRGVELSHSALNANARQIAAWDEKLVWGRERILCALPLSHSYGLSTCLNMAILTGTSVVLCDNLHPQTVVSDCLEYQISLLPAVPALYAELLNYCHAKKIKLDSIRSCISGAAPLPVELQEGFEKVTKGRIVEGYGLTEAGPVTHVNPLCGQRKPGSIGLPVPSTDACVLDLVTGLPVEPGQVGELVVRGPQLMNGYFKNSIDTVKVLRAGWLHTGDVVQCDAQGYHYVISRRVDCLSVAGQTVFPRDIEEIVYQHPAVQEVAVIAWPAPNSFTEVGFAVAQGLRAYVTIKPNRKVALGELEDFCRRHLPPGCVPDEWKVLTQLPRTPFGKLSKKHLYE